jgi:tripartite-type tricarboxylate transporter receptor subunit TctC
MFPLRRAVVAALLFAPFSSRAFAGAYPNKPIRLIVPFAPGGNADLTGRLFGEALSKRLGSPVMVENRGGAGGAIGAETASQSAPDGYTLILGSTGTFLVSPRMTGAKPPYTRASFAPVALLSTSPMDIVVNTTGPYADWPALLAALRAHPGKVTIGHPGNGSTNHLAILRLQKALDAHFNIIPYKSNGPALNDLLAGQIDSVMDQVPASIGHVRSHRLRAIVVTTPRRASQLPDVPTLAEAGVTDFAADTPLILQAPAGTPAAVVRRLNEAVSQALNDPAVKDKLADLGSDTEVMTPEALDKFLAAQDQTIQEFERRGLLKSE